MTDLLQRCEICGGLLDEEDLFCANCGTAAPAPENCPMAPQLSIRSTTHSFGCDGCGASMSYSAQSHSLQCPFCGSAALVRRPDHKSATADRAAPFRLAREEALGRLQQFLGSSFWHPGDLAESASITKLRGVYVPYWVFSAETHTFWTADSGRPPLGARGDWVPVTGEHRGSYTGLLIGASGALTPAETALICPFELGAATSSAQIDFGDAALEECTVQRKYARPLARSGLEESEKQACARRYLQGRHRNLKVNVRIEHLHSELVLLPLWIMAYRYKDQLYRFVVNGQTGKATGRAPFSTWKAVLVAISVTVLFLLLMAILVAVSAG